MKLSVLLAGAYLALATCSVQASEVVIGHGQGEFENQEETRQSVLEIRHYPGDGGVYLYARGELNDHPVSKMGDTVYLGLGYRYQNLAVEVASDDDRYITYAYYTGRMKDIEVRGGLYHGNNHSQGFKQTGLRSSAGYRINRHLSVGAHYQVGNTTMRSTDDLYGAYVKLEY